MPSKSLAVEMPVTLGRWSLKLTPAPAPTGSPELVNTMGTWLIFLMNACSVGVEAVKIKSQGSAATDSAMLLTVVMSPEALYIFKV